MFFKIIYSIFMNICSLFIKTLIQNRGEQVGGGKQKLSHSSICPVTSRDEKISFQIFITFSFKPFATLL